MRYLNRLFRSITPTAKTLRHAECGDDTTFEFTVWVVPLITMVFFIGVVVIYWSSRLPVRAAAVDCARAAIATLELPVGVNQGEEAGIKSLRNNNINATNASVQVTPNSGSWSRGDPVTCTVRLKIDLNDSSTTPAPANQFEELLFSPTASIDPAGLEIVESVTLSVEPLKSNWKN